VQKLEQSPVNQWLTPSGTASRDSDFGLPAGLGGLILSLFRDFLLDSSAHADKSLHVRFQVRKVSCPLSRAYRPGPDWRASWCLARQVGLLQGEL
jgi:hypothetical protein